MYTGKTICQPERAQGRSSTIRECETCARGSCTQSVTTCSLYFPCKTTHTGSIDAVDAKDGSSFTVKVAETLTYVTSDLDGVECESKIVDAFAHVSTSLGSFDTVAEVYSGTLDLMYPDRPTSPPSAMARRLAAEARPPRPPTMTLTTAQTRGLTAASAVCDLTQVGFQVGMAVQTIREEENSEELQHAAAGTQMACGVIGPFANYLLAAASVPVNPLGVAFNAAVTVGCGAATSAGLMVEESQLNSAAMEMACSSLFLIGAILNGNPLGIAASAISFVANLLALTVTEVIVVPRVTEWETVIYEGAYGIFEEESADGVWNETKLMALAALSMFSTSLHTNYQNSRYGLYVHQENADFESYLNKDVIYSDNLHPYLTAVAN